MTMTNGAIQPHAWRGKIIHAIDVEELQGFEDGGLLLDETGRIVACDDWRILEARGQTAPYANATSHLASEQLIIPGMIDLHVHLPQIAVTGCQADDLLSWLNTHVFREEARFADDDYARTLSRFFFQRLLAHGTTTAAVFLTSHPNAVEIAFQEALACGNRVVMGQNLMDAGGSAPNALLRDTAVLPQETEALCQRWHNRDNGRLRYAWMPRFALSCTDALMQEIGQLRQRYPDVYLHTHLSEQVSEIEAVLSRFTGDADYTAVYERFGLLAPRTILAHGIHLNDDELARLCGYEAALAHCPGSNFFLKSGRFRWAEVLASKVRFGLGSDVGAGPELSLFKAMKDAQAMQPETWISPQALFYSATLGGAKALMQEESIGNFLPGKEADFVILDTRCKPEISIATPKNSTLPLEEWLSRCIYLGDDRLVCGTWIRGRRVYAASA